MPHATSLRMGPLGYQSDAQRSLAVSYNSLASYAGSLHHALTEPYPPYDAIGVRDGDGDYRQLATTLLQIENEFYGTIRPKRRIRRGERPLHALTERGVEYVEVRSLDLDPFSPVGIDTTDDALSRRVPAALPAVRQPARHAGRDRRDRAQPVPRRRARPRAGRGAAPARRRHRSCRNGDGSCSTNARRSLAALDLGRWCNVTRMRCAAAHDALRDPERTPSARVLREMKQDYGDSYIAFALAKSLEHRRALLDLPFPDDANARLQQMADESLEAQRTIEEADDVPFEVYREQYLAQDLMSGMRLEPTSAR